MSTNKGTPSKMGHRPTKMSKEQGTTTPPPVFLCSPKHFVHMVLESSIPFVRSQTINCASKFVHCQIYRLFSIHQVLIRYFSQEGTSIFRNPHKTIFVPIYKINHFILKSNPLDKYKNVTGGRKRLLRCDWTLLSTRPVGMVDCNLIQKIQVVKLQL